MDFELITKKLTNMLREVEPQSFFELNRSNNVIYPYLTYTFDWERIDHYSVGIWIDIDLFDKNTSYINLFKLETKLQQYFNSCKELDEHLFIMFGHMTGAKIPTNDEKILRRYVRVYCKIEWRKNND